MRLINAEEFEVISWNAQGQLGDYARGYDDGVQYMAEKIDHAPTIDAIPVEWLKAQNNSTEYYKTIQGQAVELILKLWKNEQEARTV